MFEKMREKGIARQQAAAEKAQLKSREAATKKGIRVDDALFVGKGVGDTMSHTEFLVIRPTVVELHKMPKAGSVLRQGAGVESMPFSAIASVDSTQDGLFTKVSFNGSGHSLSTKLDVNQGPAAAQTGMDQLNRLRG